MSFHFPFDNTYARLPDRFFARVAPTPVVRPRLIRLNRELANQLGLDADWLASSQGVDTLAGKHLPQEAEPIAMAYAGHQFGHFNPQLGDGRAILLGEVVDRDGTRRDIQLKGSGRTPQEVKALLKQFGEMQKMMGQLGKMAKKGKMPPGLGGPGGGGFPGLPLR